MAPSRLHFRHVLIDDNNPRHPHCKAAGDIDGDGRPDLLAASADGGGLYWYRYPDWTKHKIADGSFTTGMDVGDIDGHGRRGHRRAWTSGTSTATDTWTSSSLVKAALCGIRTR